MTENQIEQVYLLAGIALLVAATIPRLFKNRAITAPMLVIGIGALGGLVLGQGGFESAALMSS